MDEGVKWASVMAVVSALAAAVVGIAVIDYILGNPAGGFDVLFVPLASVAAAILGGTLWWALVERSRRLTYARAITVGILIGVLAHPLTWTFYTLGGPLFLPGGWSEPWVMVEVTLMFTVLSVLFSGVLTIIGSILCGLVVMRCRRWAQSL